MAALGDNALPTLGRAVRLSRVASHDYGGGTKVFPNDFILVEPCDRFTTAGVYQIATSVESCVVSCRPGQSGEIWMRGEDRGLPAETLIVSDEKFSEMVCGRVVARIDLMPVQFLFEIIDSLPRG